MVRRKDERGQATVELAVLAPVITLLVVAILQAGVLVADRLAVLDAARIGARAAALRPDVGSVERALADHGVDLHGGSVHLSGDLRAGGIARMTVERPPTRLVVVGRFLGRSSISETVVFRVEDPDGGS